MLRSYYQLTKPGIVKGNALAAIAGFFLASRGQINVWLFLAMLTGISLIIASGCVFNNFIDRNIDRKMTRTKGRALAVGSISSRNALVYGSILGMISVFVLFVYTNILTAVIAVIGFFFYVVVYGVWKRRSEYGTLVGSISGAVPPVVGYVAVTNNFDLGALLLFVILTVWQMPHFYAIAIYRMKDYKEASIPVLPVVRGIKTTKIHTLLYIIAFIVASALLALFGYTGYIYLFTVSLVGLFWLWIGIKGFGASDNVRWAKKMFGFSLVCLLVFCVLVSIDALLH